MWERGCKRTRKRERRGERKEGGYHGISSRLFLWGHLCGRSFGERMAVWVVWVWREVASNERTREKEREKGR